jgi:hypothetical protein
MLGDHIALAMALERQRDLVPELRKVELARENADVDDGEAGAARVAGTHPEAASRARFRFRSSAKARGAKCPIESP